MPYMHSTRSPQLQWSTKGLLGVLRASLPPGGPQAGRTVQAPRPARTVNDPPEPLSVHEVSEAADDWLRRSREDEDRAASVAQAAGSLAESRRSAAAPARR